MVKDNDNDSFVEAYTTYVKPFVSSTKLPGRGITDEENADITTGIGVDTDAMLDLNQVVLPENIVIQVVQL